MEVRARRRVPQGPVGQAAGAILDDRRGVLFLTAASMAGAVTQASAGVGVGSGDTTYKAYLT